MVLVHLDDHDQINPHGQHQRQLAMKLTLALTHLNRREPIVYFGCTWTEIKAGVFGEAPPSRFRSRRR